MRAAQRGGRVEHWPETGGAYAGYAVLDPRGKRVGRVREAFLNVHGEPEYLNVGIGWLGLRTALIPVLDVVADEGGRTLTLQ